METIYDRTAALLGRQAVETLKKKAVIVFGIGGVGGFAVEALARTGVGRLGLVDFDTVAESNRNRQLAALGSTLGRGKASVMVGRVSDINPDVRAEAFETRLTEETLPLFRLGEWDYVVDAIDDVPAKLLLIREAKALGVPIICAMGAGNKLNPAGFRVADVSKTHTCPLARIIRREVGKEGLGLLKVVFSPEEPQQAAETEDGTATAGKRPPGSVVFAVGAAGLLLASEVVKDLLA